MADKKIIAVIGATGAQGGGLVHAIMSDKSSGFTVRALTRNVNSEKAKALANLGVEVVAANIDDMESMRKTFDGAYGAFCGARNLVVSRVLNPALQTFDQWLAKNKSRIPLES
ncbi:MAG: NmrA family NAD(P)-binding protein [Candidatus Manganitrophaceae bacterium]